MLIVTYLLVFFFLYESVVKSFQLIHLKFSIFHFSFVKLRRIASAFPTLLQFKFPEHTFNQGNEKKNVTLFNLLISLSFTLIIITIIVTSIVQYICLISRFEPQTFMKCKNEFTWWPQSQFCGLNRAFFAKILNNKL